MNSWIDLEKSTREFLLNRKNNNNFIFSNQELKNYLSTLLSSPNAIKPSNLSARVSDILTKMSKENNPFIFKLRNGLWIIIELKYKKPKFDNELFFNFSIYISNLILDKNENIIKEVIGTTVIEGNTILDKKEYNNRTNNDPEKIEQDNINKIIENLNSKIINSISISMLLNLHSQLFVKIKTNIIVGKFREKQNFINTGFMPCKQENLDNEINAYLNFYKEKPIDINESFSRAIYLHLWFEMIHPFGDGNGRIGRLLLSYYFKYHGFTDYLLGFGALISNSKDKYIKALRTSNHQKLFNFFIDLLVM